MFFIVLGGAMTRCFTPNLARLSEICFTISRRWTTAAEAPLWSRIIVLKVAVLPLLKKKPEITKLAKELASDLKKCFKTVYDDTASIGRLYRRQDEIGTPYCITVDVDSLQDKKVTVRDRDTMKQDRIEIANIKEYMSGKLK